MWYLRRLIIPRKRRILNRFNSSSKMTQKLSFNEFWDFFCKQQSHLNSGEFHFTHKYIAETMQAAKNVRFQNELNMTLELVWSTAISFGLWNTLAELDVKVDYGRVSLEALAHS